MDWFDKQGQIHDSRLKVYEHQRGWSFKAQMGF